jgi:hypothetical protein
MATLAGLGSIEKQSERLETGAPTYTLVDETIDDTPGKTQIEQHIVVSGTPTAAQLEAEILKRYRAAAARRGFRYHDRPTNIYIYVYGTEEQARAGQGLWIGMIAKNFSDTDEPEVRTNEGRLAALSKAQEERFGLSDEDRRTVFREIAAAEDRAMCEAREQVPDDKWEEQIELERDLMEQYKAEVAEEHGLTEDYLLKISVEGVESGWITPPFPC